MRTLMVMVMKFVCCLIAFSVGLDLFFQATITEIVSFSLLVTIVSYFIGDRLILPAFGNATASIIDFFLTYGVVWIFGSVVLTNYLQIAWGSVLSAVIVTIGEVFLHYYLLTRDLRTEPLNERSKMAEPGLSYSMEFAEENEMNYPNRQD